MGEPGARSELQAADVTKRTLWGNAGPRNQGQAQAVAAALLWAHRRPPCSSRSSSTHLKSDSRAGESSPEAVTRPLHPVRPGPPSFAAALRAGEGPSRPAHPGCRAPRLSTSASCGCVLCDPRWVAAAMDLARSRAWNSDLGLERRPSTDTQPDLPERPNPRIPRARSGCTAIAPARLTWQGGGGWGKGAGGTGGGVPPGQRGLCRGHYVSLQECACVCLSFS